MNLAVQVYNVCGSTILSNTGKKCHSLDVKYTKQVYNQLLRCIEVQPNKLTWATQVRDLLARYGFYHVWLQYSVDNTKLFIQAVKQRIHDVDVQVLNDTFSNSTRALFYRNISQFEFSLYLDVIQVKQYRTAMNLSNLVDGTSHYLFLSLNVNVPYVMFYKMNFIS